MNRQELRELFETHRSEYLAFERVANPRSKRPDLHAFLLLDELVPGNKGIISCAEHDEIGLSVSLYDLTNIITEEQVIELIRCGVRIDDAGRVVMFA